MNWYIRLNKCHLEREREREREKGGEGIIKNLKLIFPIVTEIPHFNTKEDNLGSRFTIQIQKEVWYTTFQLCMI